MKRITVIILVLSLLLTGCDGGEEQTGKISDGNMTETVDTESGRTPEDSDPGDEDMGIDSEDKDSGIDVDIKEKMYVAYINEIYVNTDDYIGKVIRIQGMFQAYTDENTGLTYYYVYRTGPGCCGNDGAMCGFEFTWDGDIPSDNDWIEVTGSLRTYEEDGWIYLTLDAESVTVMEERGAETVFQ